MRRFQAVVRLSAVFLWLSLGVSPAAYAKTHYGRAHKPRLPADYAAWSRVARCEEGGWYAPGGFYPDALGINATNLAAFGGRPDHGRLSLTRRVAEIRVADRLVAYYGVSIPDQWGGCAAW